ncbi:hypothetical protein SBY92_004592 [Candida maltosa Xu316]|uniref:DASH complex subunit DUO1 n=1 Tax=Candida maltosa (strain Xu316) TaxID=1245528 RepID=M3IHX3_CANMX|nr:DASH complex subunit, putative [Candida maltosa Xu316]
MSSSSSRPVTPQNRISRPITSYALEQELEQITQINQTLDQFLGTIEKINGDLNQINTGATNSLILMNKWIDIISRADFTLSTMNNNGWNFEGDNEDYGSDDLTMEEKELSNRLRIIEQENVSISKKIENIAKEKNSRMNRRKM